VSEREPIGVVGAGWVGLVTAACFAEMGHPAVVREIVADKVEKTRGMTITITTTAKTDPEGRALLKNMGMPFAS